MGLIFAEPFHTNSDRVILDSRVFPNCEGSSHGGVSAYNEINGVSSGSALIICRVKEARDAKDLKIYFSSDLQPLCREVGGWMFLQTPSGRAYLAIKPSRGDFGIWEQAKPTDKMSEGWWLTLQEQNIPIVFQAGLQTQYADLDVFMKTVLGCEFRWLSESEFVFGGLKDSAKLTWRSDKKLPSINDSQLILPLKNIYESPYLNCVSETGRIFIKNFRGESMQLDFLAK
jgi:hypothetical protein